jgi:hypothetical protein
MSNNQNAESLLKSLNSDIDELTALTKSFFEKVKKAEGAEEEEGKDPIVEDSVGGDEPPMPQEGEGEMPAEGEMPMEGEMPTDEGDLGSYVQGLDDSELKNILTALMDEYEARLGGGEEGMEKADGLGLGAPSVPPAPIAPDPMLGKAGELPPPEGQDGLPPMPEEGMEDPNAAEGAAPNEESVRQAVATLSPEEKQLLLQILQEGEQPQQGLAAELPAGAPPAQKSLKLPTKEFGGDKAADGSKESVAAFGALKKSLDEFNSRLAKLEKSVKAPTETMPTRQYASQNPEVVVLEKSVGNEGRMDGMSLANWLIGQQRQGNKLVKSILVTKANLAKSEDSLNEVYSELKNLGITPPK